MKDVLLGPCSRCVVGGGRRQHAQIVFDEHEMAAIDSQR